MRAVRLGVAGGCVAILTAACSSSGSGAASGSAGTSGPAAVSSGAGTPADGATLSAISHAYATFFSSASTTPQSQAVLQHGEQFTRTLEEQAKSTYADTSSATVDSARLISPDVAAVTFTVTSGGSALLPKAPGFAVRTDSTWQVAAQTFCGLLKLEQAAPDACDDPAVTALPD